LILAVGVLLASGAFAADAPRASDLADLSLEELANIPVTSVSKHPEPLANAAASIFVITGEDIRRSGATRLPEALRLAPNLQVALANASTYAISARGFNGTTANKLLVLIDGRIVYTPLFSGVFWDVQDVLLDDVERIEVISGPAGTLWGANAVNGVINVITRSARDNRGPLYSVSSGNRETDVAMRVVGPVGEEGAARFYVKGFNRSSTELSNGASANDAWGRQQAGFRADWGSAESAFTFQGDTYSGSNLPGTAQFAPTVSGDNLLGRWNRDLAQWGQLQVQGSFDRTERDIPGTFAESLDLYDIEVQHSLRALGAHSITWGGGYRYGTDHVTNSAVLAFLPADRNLRWSNVFVQDEIALKDNLRLTLGAKFENNYYTGTDFMPSVRLAWKPEPQHLLWGAVSRAVRAPSRIDRDFFVNAPPVLTLQGGPGFMSEIVDAFEVGYRAQPSPQVSYSLSAFHNIYDKLRSLEPAPGGASVLDNKMQGTTDGLEAWGTYQAAKNWRLSAGGFLLKERLNFKPDSGDTNIAAAGNDPAHQLMLRSSHELPDRSQLDVIVRHVGALPNPSVPSYTVMDVRYGMRLRRDLELTLAAQNLLDAPHAEFGGTSVVSKSGYVGLKWTP